MMKITEQIDELLALHATAKKGDQARQMKTIFDRAPALLRVLRTLLEERDARMPYMGATDADFLRSLNARERTNAAIREAEDQI